MGSGSINQMISKLCVLRSWLIPPGTTPRIESPNCCNDSWVVSPLLKNHKMTLPRDIYKAFYLYLGKRHIQKHRGCLEIRENHDIQEHGTSQKSGWPGNSQFMISRKSAHPKNWPCIRSHMYVIYMRTCDVIWMCTVNVISIHMYTNASLWIYIYIYISVVYIHLYIYCYTYIYITFIYICTSSQDWGTNALQPRISMGRICAIFFQPMWRILCHLRSCGQQ